MCRRRRRSNAPTWEAPHSSQRVRPPSSSPSSSGGNMRNVPQQRRHMRVSSGRVAAHRSSRTRCTSRSARLEKQDRHHMVTICSSDDLTSRANAGCKRGVSLPVVMYASTPRAATPRPARARESSWPTQFCSYSYSLSNQLMQQEAHYDHQRQVGDQVSGSACFLVFPESSSFSRVDSVSHLGLRGMAHVTAVHFLLLRFRLLLLLSCS